MAEFGAFESLNDLLEQAMAFTVCQKKQQQRSNKWT